MGRTSGRDKVCVEMVRVSRHAFGQVSANVMVAVSQQLVSQDDAQMNFIDYLNPSQTSSLFIIRNCPCCSITGGR